MKSIKFTHFREKLVNGTKCQTIRCLMVPRYLEGETVKINFDAKDGRPVKTLFCATVTPIDPKRLAALTEEEALLDGFGSRAECILGLQEINHVKSDQQWAFVIRFERVKSPLAKFLEENPHV